MNIDYEITRLRVIAVIFGMASISIIMPGTIIKKVISVGVEQFLLSTKVAIKNAIE